MNKLPSTNPVRRLLSRGLATGLLVSQLAPMLSAQTAPAKPDAEPAAKKETAEEVVRLDKFEVTAGFSGSLGRRRRDQAEADARR